MKKIILLLPLLLFFSCEKSLSQDTKEQMKQNENFWKYRAKINEKNIVEYPVTKDTIIKEKRRNNIHISSKECQLEVLIDDVLLYKLTGDITKQEGSKSFNLDINQLLLTSGTHEIKIRMYPKYGLPLFNNINPLVNLTFFHYENSNFKDQIYFDDMGGSSGIELSASNEHWVDDQGIYGEPGFVEAHYEAKEPIKFEGLPFYEWKKTFEAEVPFNFIGWRSSVNLKKEQEEEKKDIKTELFEEYKRIYKILENKDLQAYLSLVKERENLFKSCLFYEKNEKTLQEIEFTELIKNNDYELQSLFEETFQLEFQGYGKLVMLLNKADGEGIIRLKNRKYPDDIIYMDFRFQRKKKGDKLTLISGNVQQQINLQ
ncbi:PH domain-containing protein [Apibacter adventoris]|uniref:Uncharacterized protein n=1 Tax=Apibacter adventoris TaxID=1679466 RepID=A0A2S8ACL3_9FLAO|nr:hypothetical protein [Apibacter adventoris]PQL92362.1 hypothetical protein C4S77_06735 [Apibacter adventoris]